MSSKHFTHKVWLFATLCLFVLSACAGSKTGSQNTEQHEDDTPIARNLQLYREGNAWVARIPNPSDTATWLGTYIFPDTDTTTLLPQMDVAYTFTPKQLDNLLVYSTVHVAALKELGKLDAVKLIGDAQYFTDPVILDGLKSGRIQDAGAQANPVNERIIAAKPALMLVSYYDGVDVSALSKLGIPIVWMCEAQENSPLGRAEWLKLLGLIAGNKQKADSIYADVTKEYNSICRQTKNLKAKPKVMVETMYQGSWGTAGGRSYAAKLIEDAGGDYIFKDDDSTGSIQLSFESMLSKAQDADIWLIRVFGYDLTLDGLKKIDERNMLFKPAKTGGVWGANTQNVPFFEETPFHPNLALKDYLSIFHPELTKGYTPRYFKRAE